MKLEFVMGNIDISAYYELPNGNKRTLKIVIPSCNLFDTCVIKYKPIIIYGTKGKRSRKESK